MLRNYVFNPRTVLASLRQEIKETSNKKVLMYDEKWTSFATNFHKVKPEMMTGERLPTKRELLSATISLFNLVCELSPITTKPQILFQDV